MMTFIHQQFSTVRPHLIFSLLAGLCVFLFWPVAPTDNPAPPAISYQQSGLSGFFAGSVRVPPSERLVLCGGHDGK
jgi:xanthosine utilization system XapX-like protein